MGHLNVRFYVDKCMEALVALAGELGMPHAFSPRGEATLLVRELHIRFMREALPRAALYITGGVLEMMPEEARLLLVMRHASGELAASFQLRVAHATGREGRAFPWPERVRARAAALQVAVPGKAAPRSIGLGPVESQASLPLAQRLGLRRIGMGAIRPADCDPFGRMRPEVFMARISDGMVHFLEGRRPVADRPGRRLGGAVLEYRLVYLDWPRLGDRLELRSGTPGCTARVRRLVHWLLDPLTGRAWGAAEAVAAAFDLDARKIVTMTEDEVAAWRSGAVEGLSI